jgi:hypothetical protein
MLHITVAPSAHPALARRPGTPGDLPIPAALGATSARDHGLSLAVSYRRTMKWAQDDLQALLTRTTSTSPVSTPLHLFVREVPNCFCP